MGGITRIRLGLDAHVTDQHGRKTLKLGLPNQGFPVIGYVHGVFTDPMTRVFR
jgi:hypothetical protein